MRQSPSLHFIQQILALCLGSVEVERVGPLYAKNENSKGFLFLVTAIW